jgi:hypothetical protein
VALQSKGKECKFLSSHALLSTSTCTLDPISKAVVDQELQAETRKYMQKDSLMGQLISDREKLETERSDLENARVAHEVRPCGRVTT